MKYLIISDLDEVKLAAAIEKADLVKCLEGRTKWLIDLEERKAFAPTKNEWLPLDNFPVY